MTKSLPKPIQFLFENSLFLIFGTIGALVWANLDKESHNHFFHFQVQNLFYDSAADKVESNLLARDADHDDHLSQPEFESILHDADLDQDADLSAAEIRQLSESLTRGDHQDEHEHQAGEHETVEAADDHQDSEHPDVHLVSESGEHTEHHIHPIDFHFLINDVLMAFFFAIAAKEVWESLLPGGALSSFRKAATPLLATAGGILGPVFLFLAGAFFFASDFGQMSRGWAVPCATDIAFSYLVARLIFGAGHPAIAFLLLLAIADDAAGLIILAVAFPQGEIQSQWLLLTIGAMLLALIFNRSGLKSFWWYLLIPGVMCWYSFYSMNIHAALGLVPIIPFMPAAKRDRGIFDPSEAEQTDTLNQFEHWWKNPVELFLGLFGLCNAGVVLSSFGTGTTLVLVGLLIGKPLGITLATWIADKVFKLDVPKGMKYRHVITLGCIAGIGFTVSLFVSTAAFPANSPYLDPIKMGALLSFAAAIVSFVVAYVLGVKKNDHLKSE